MKERRRKKLVITDEKQPIVITVVCSSHLFFRNKGEATEEGKHKDGEEDTIFNQLWFFRKATKY